MSAALPARLAPLAQAMRRAGGLVVSTHFTLVPGRGGEPLISPHLKALRPYLSKGDFLPGAWGHQLVDELAPRFHGALGRSVRVEPGENGVERCLLLGRSHARLA